MNTHSVWQGITFGLGFALTLTLIVKTVVFVSRTGATEVEGLAAAFLCGVAVWLFMQLPVGVHNE